MSSRSIPPVPLAFGLAGLIPFWGLALAVAARGMGGLAPASLALALAAYGALILSFLGGIRWGLAVAAGDDGAPYAISVVPSLVAWALLAAPEPWRCGGLGCVLLALGPFDGASLARVAPPWFRRLRIILSCGAGVALLLAAASLARSCLARS